MYGWTGPGVAPPPPHSVTPDTRLVRDRLNDGEAAIEILKQIPPDLLPYGDSARDWLDRVSVFLSTLGR